MAIIKTPDQRVRVFISSTINELAEERQAARDAISNLRLIPVFFEAGARPHPPRDLYSAYLDQSHIFLGIYWNSYGWVAPGADISGLEDEYRLCGNSKPKLIYVKKSDQRQDRLNQLLADIEKSETACYQLFSDAAELQKLIENDLSVLMSEIFENAIFQNLTEKSEEINSILPHKKLNSLPLIKSEIYGRDEDLKKITELILKPGTSLITLLGAGGTGKTTMSIHLGHNLIDNFEDGAVFVPLAPITDSKLVTPTIAEILGIQDSGKQPIEQTIVDFLSDKEMLLILDNFEQVIGASKFVSTLISACSKLKVLITSRTSLHIRNEWIYNLSPLDLPDEDKKILPDELRNFPATQLFVERALEVNPRMEFNDENTRAIIEICQRMDGLPLAIELAAARTRFFQPAALMLRIEKTLDLVSKGQKDLPERQQTLRAAIEWSYNLLSPDTQRVFRQLGIFKRSWTMDAADIVINGAMALIDIEEMTERLLDVSLIKPVLVNHTSEPRFNMLQTVHEYAREMLDISEDAKETKLRYANYFYNLCSESENELWLTNSEAWLDKLEYEYQNIRAAFYIYLELSEIEKAWKVFYLMVPYWTLRGGFSESLQWIEDAGINKTNEPSTLRLNPKVVGRALTWAAFVKLFLMQLDEGFNLLHQVQNIIKETDDENTLALSLILDGCYGSFMGFPDSPAKIDEAKLLADKLNDPVLLTFFYTWSYEYYRQLGQKDLIEDNLNKAFKVAQNNQMTYVLGSIYILRFSLATINMDTNFEELSKMSLEMYKLFPAKGYKGLKAAALSGYAYSLIKLGKIEDAASPIKQSLEYTRESGEKESEFYGTLLASNYAMLLGDTQKACKLFGAIDSFVTATNYPLVGGAEAQYNETKKVIFGDGFDAEKTKWYDLGKQISLTDAIIFALN